MERQRIGRAAENWAAEWLAGQGLRVLARNWRTPAGEVDLLCADGTALVAVEVKARHPLSWARGEEALEPRQRRRLARALEWEARRRRWPGPLRLDLLFVEWVGRAALGATWFRAIEVTGGE